eukprot:CAMPEP_0180257674 /NCGR_PEP_ID=MMETSP0987-20121128/41982_1 /TAXON_ID=697907 /ORGANISM="non described non described, Strain CCMP2293" /LENGTH=32 /DNA_ID= /DNA_START= /DNA_END= /DNA_ORIENTATION=
MGELGIGRTKKGAVIPEMPPTTNPDGETALVG